MIPEEERPEEAPEPFPTPIQAVALTLNTHKAMTSPVRIKSLMRNLRVFSFMVQL